MDPYNSYSSSSYSSPYSSYNSPYTHFHSSNDQNQSLYGRPAHSDLRKNAMKKQPIAPMPPTKPKVYKVDPVDFMNVVQKLTGPPEQQKQRTARLHEVAPPHLNLSPPRSEIPITMGSYGYGGGSDFMAERQDDDQMSWKSFENTFGAIEFNLLSPSWYSSLQLSPGSISNLV